MKKFLTGNEPQWRLLRTVAQSVIGIALANADTLFAYVTIDEALKPIIVALVMAVLSPIMAMLGGAIDKGSNGEKP